ncbi:MAG: hypothetical protein ACI9SC_002977 [Gammaproteobacteria bacterium]|jgi:hypothetical protein
MFSPKEKAMDRIVSGVASLHKGQWTAQAQVEIHAPLFEQEETA